MVLCQYSQIAVTMATRIGFFVIPMSVENFFRGHVGTVPRSMCAKLKVRTFRHLELLAFNPKNWGSRDPNSAPPFREIFSGVISEH